MKREFQKLTVWKYGQDVFEDQESCIRQMIADELEQEPVRNKHLENFVKGRLNAFSETKDRILEDQAEAVTLEDRETFFTEE